MREGGYYHYAIICYNSENKSDIDGRACMCSYFSMLENKTIQIKHSISEFLFFGSLICEGISSCPAHRMPNAFLVG